MTEPIHDIETNHEATKPDSAEVAFLLRNTQQHHVSLSGMADQKSGFLIGGSIVLLGLVLGQLGTTRSYGLLAAGLTALVTLALAILAVIPRFHPGTKVGSGNPNTLFFGVFANIDEKTWIDAHMDLLEDSAKMRRAMLRDIHQMGTSLYRRKYRYLAYAFRVAFIGYGLSFGVALVEFVIL